jgi:NAD(P)-dependent dehydrogenase (short-subunit alcohol dehydrogenase family)
MKSRVALITGGASGIGRATAERLIAAGGRVVIADVASDGETVADQIGATFHRLDVSDADAWGSALASVNETLGGLDLLHLNAGVQSAPRGVPLGDDPFAWVTQAGFRRVSEINVRGVVNGVIAARHLPPHERPADIVITASIAGVAPLSVDPLYSMSKHAVIGFARSIAPTLDAVGIRLQVICPGGVDTALPPPDLRIPGHVFAPASYIADGVLHALEMGAAGDVWMATDAGVPYWKYEFTPVRRAAPAPVD